LALSLTWTWRHVWETWELHWGFNRGRWKWGSGIQIVKSRSSYLFFLLFFLCIMLTQHINGQGCLMFDIFVNVFAETYIMAGYLCKVVLEPINASTTFFFSKFTKELRVSKNLVTISPSKVLPRHCFCFGLVFKLRLLFRFGVVPSI